MGHNINISSSKRVELVQLHHHVKDRRIADRIKAVLMLDEGYTYAEVSRVLLLGTDTIKKCEKRFHKGGVDSLTTLFYVGYSGKLTEEQERELREHLRSHVFQTALEVQNFIKKCYEIHYSHDGTIKLLHRLGFSYKKTKGVPARADKEKQEEFLETYKNIRENLKEDEKLYFMDAAHPVYNSVPSYAWIEKGKEKELPQVSGRQRINLNGLYSPIDGETLIRTQEKITGKTTLELLQAIRRKHLELSKIVIIHDNARAYHARYLKDHLPEGITMVALPSYSPNLNLIERLWKLFRKDVMNNHYHETFDDFKHATSNFFRHVHWRRDDLMSLMTENFHIIQN